LNPPCSPYAELSNMRVLDQRAIRDLDTIRASSVMRKCTTG
jgi:hypothetical protein